MLKPLAAVFTIVVLIGCSSSDTTLSDSTSTTPLSRSSARAEVAERAADSVQGVGVPGVVADIGTHGEDLYDEAKAANWTRARMIMDSLDRSASRLRVSERGELAGALDTVRRAVGAHDRQAALEGANRVTFLAAHLTEAYHPKMPADVVRLDYYGRELEIWAGRNDTGKLASTRADLQRTWAAVRPDVISHGGGAAATHADSLVARLAAAKTARDYAAIAKPFLDVVDELEKPFEK